jgi:diacylglycerol kinase (ATP)
MEKFLRNAMAVGKAFLYSMDGLKFLLRERAFKQELLLGLLLGFIEIFRNTSVAMLLYLFSSYIIVLVLEGLNSAIETAIDRIGPALHDLSKKAKDIGSAVVFIALVHLGIVWTVSWFV